MSDSLFQRRETARQRLGSVDYCISREGADFISRNFSRKFQTILDYGAGESPLKSLFQYENYIAADITQNSSGTIQLIIDKETGAISQPDRSVDLVVAIYSLEHVNDFWGSMQEIERVLKPGGEFLCLVPFINREHEVPYDQLRFTSFFWQQSRITGQFQVLEVRKIGNFWVTAFSLWYERFTYEGSAKQIGILARLIRKIYRNTLLPLFNLTLFRRPPGEEDSVYYQLIIHLRRN